MCGLHLALADVKRCLIGVLGVADDGWRKRNKAAKQVTHLHITEQLLLEMRHYTVVSE